MKLRAFLFLLASLLFVPAASGTWSIVLVNTATGEVGLASATCINGGQLKPLTGTLVVGKGAGAVQAGGDSGVFWRKHIFDGLAMDLTADELFDMQAPSDTALGSRQIGIAGPTSSVTHTGISNANWAGGVEGQFGTIRYAIQGNIMACPQVVNKMEKTLKKTRGDMGQVLMEMMIAARSKGGDWRCSCQLKNSDAQGGCPGCPPEGALRASSTAFMVVARMGDTDGVCTPAQGCVNGDYYMDLEVFEWLPFGSVYELEQAFKTFRQTWRGHADHLLSKPALSADSVPADGMSSATIELALVDIHRNPLTAGGATISIEHTENSAGAARIGDVLDHGDGTYTIELSAGISTGLDEFRIVVEDGMGPVTLFPYPTLESVAPALTALGGLGEGASDVLLLSGGEALAGQPYVLLAEGESATPVVLGFGELDAEGRGEYALTSDSVGAPSGSESTPTVRLRWVALGPVSFVSNSLEVEPRRSDSPNQ